MNIEPRSLVFILFITKSYTYIMKLLLLTAILFFSQFAISQTGSIKGQIKDNKTGETLIGANVIIKGTNKGAIADFDGNFIINNLAEGEYTLICSFISYQQIIISNVKVKANTATELNFAMQSEAVSIVGATVTARAVRNSENALVAMQLKSATSVNGISEKEISMNGDGDAASSLSRVSGVTIQDGKYIYVRGLGDRYSRTDLNGAMVPSLDPEKNNIQLDLFPSSIINNMMVYKTFSPELPANFAGGYVNIETKKFPEEFMVEIGTTVGINSQATFNKNFMTYAGGKTDFLGFDDGTRAIPEAAQGNIPFRYQDDEKLDNITRSFNKTMSPTTKAAPFNHGFNFTIGNNHKLFGKEVGYLFSYTYKHDYRYYEGGENGQYTLSAANSKFLQRDLQYTDSRGVDYVLWGLMGSASLKLNDNSSISLNIIRNQSGNSTSRYQEGWNNYHEVNVQTRSLQYAQRSFTTAQLLGEHTIKKLHKLKVKWHTAYSLSIQEQPDLRFFTNIYDITSSEDTIYKIDPAKQGVPARYWRNMQEYNFDTKIDFELPYEFLSNNSSLKFGGKLMTKNRDFSERRFDVNDNNDSYKGDVTEYLRDENIGMTIPEFPSKYGVFISDATQLSNTYFAYQNLIAAYLMTDQQINNKLRAVYGVRMETTDIYLESAKKDNPKGQLQNVDFLPAINLTFKPNKKINLRAAYTRTLARPSFRELAPYASFEFSGDYTLIGNENLERTLIDNIDFRFEWAMKPGELLSFDVFYKGFINPIERTFVTTAVGDELTFKNSDRADVYGIEFEIRKNLNFISGLKNFKVGLNVALVNSIVNIATDELDVIRTTDPTAAATRTMYGQAPYIINTYLNYSLKKIGLDARIVYNTTGEKLAVVVKGGTPNIYQAPRHSLNFTLKKSFGTKFSIILKASNLLNSTYVKNYTFNNKEYIYSSYNTGQAFAISFKYKL